MEENGRIDIQISENIATVEFYHPKSNSFPGILLKELTQAIEELGMDDYVRVIILQSSGEKAFCAGASFDELLAIRDLDTGKEFFMGFARVINAMRKCPKLIIGRIQGKAVGGGVGLASCVDYCLATDKASIKLSELAIGIGPFVVGPAVERKIGNGAFQVLSIDTGWRSAEWAREKGLYADIFPSIRDLDNAVFELSHKLAATSPEAMKMLKEAMWHGTGHWDEFLEARAEISGKLVLSEFTSNAIAQFKNS